MLFRQILVLTCPLSLYNSEVLAFDKLLTILRTEFGMTYKRLLTSCFGLGLIPFAPGTFGSALACFFFMVVALLSRELVVCQYAMAVTGLLYALGTVKFSKAAIECSGDKDPSEVVSDEYAGQALCLLIASFSVSFELYPLTSIFVCFLLFRVFDITKLWPICKLEKLPGGIGILADDLLAGVYGAVAFFVMGQLGAVETIADFALAFSTQFHTALVAAGLGAVQGLTEFLPVSSSGHLVLLESIIPGLNPDSPEMLLFDLTVHVGTVLSILVVFRKDIVAFVKSLFNIEQNGFNPVQIYKKNFAWHFGVCAAVTTVVTVVLYKIFEEPLEASRKLGVVCVAWLVTAALLFITDLKGRARLKLREFGILGAVIVGVAQSMAILPGISRSGATICAAILFGLHRKWAIQYSFLIAMPAILGGTLLTALDNKELLGSGTLSIPVMLTGVITSCLVGLVALRLLIFLNTRKKLKFFGIYCIVISVVSFLFFMK